MTQCIFSACRLIVDEDEPAGEILAPAFEKRKGEEFQFNERYYLISAEIISNDYFWLYAEYGKPEPYSKKVMNTESMKIENNPKAKTQVETSQQVFFLYSIPNKTLYVSNEKQKEMFIEYLKKKLSTNVRIQNFFKNVDEFIKTLKGINQVKFTAKRNLFNSGRKHLEIISKAPDILGLGAPESFSLEFKYKNKLKDSKFASMFKKLADDRREGALDDLICIGYDQDNFKTIYDMDKFKKKISIGAGKDENGMYNCELVKTNLLQELKT